MSAQQRMTAADWRRDRLVEMVEGEFSTRFAELAERTGWQGYHTHDSRRSEPGFPDWVLARRGRLVVAELKRVTGAWGEGQREWLAAIAGDDPGDWHFGRSVRISPLLTVACWTPLDLEEITEVLT